jgi:hypothetical protein
MSRLMSPLFLLLRDLTQFRHPTLIFSKFNVMLLPIGSYFLSRVSTGTGSSGDGSLLVAAAPGSNARVLEEVRSVSATSSTSAHLPEELGPVAAALVMAQKAILTEMVEPVSIATVMTQSADSFSSMRPSAASKPTYTTLTLQVASSARLPASPCVSAPTDSESTSAPVAASILRIPLVENDHRMATQGKQGFRQLRERLNLHAATLSPLPKTYRGALVDPNWRDAMSEEFATLQANDTWFLVPRPTDTNVVTSKQVFQHKFFPGALDHYKAQWVLYGFTSTWSGLWENF